MLALREFMETYKEGKEELHSVFVDLEKANNREPKEELWHCQEWEWQMGLHQWSDQSPTLFDMVTDEVRQEHPWTLMFADDIMNCSQIREQVKESEDGKTRGSEGGWV